MKKQEIQILDDEPTDIDYLGRQNFAESRARLIANAPKDSSFRIGIYGSWGQGKTSVMKIIDSILDSNIARVHFSPWNYNNSEDIRKALIFEIAKNLGLSHKEAGILSGIRKSNIMDGLSGFHPLAKAISSVAAYGFTKWDDKRFNEAVNFIYEKLISTKVVVFVDDLDRIKAELLPDILLSIREIYNFPNIHYVIGLDPNIISNGLSSIHSGWGKSKDFLEKIIEYPAHLPEIDNEILARFVETQIVSLKIDKISLYVDSIKDLLPRNPRKIKKYLRFISCIIDQIDRFDDDEVNKSQILLMMLFKIEYTEAYFAVVSDEKFEEKIQNYEYEKIKSRMTKEEIKNEDLNDFVDGYLLDKNDMYCKNILLRIINLKAKKVSILDSFNFDSYYCYFTFKELKEFISGDVDDVDLGLEKNNSRQFSEILQKMVEIRYENISMTINSNTEAGQFEFRDNVLKFGGMIFKVIDFYKDDQLKIDFSCASNILNVLLKYINFNHPEKIYSDIHKQSFDIINKLTDYFWICDFNIYKLVKRWHIHRPRDLYHPDNKQISSKIDEILMRIESNIVDIVIKGFEMPEYIANMEYEIRQSLFHDVESKFYFHENLEKMKYVLNEVDGIIVSNISEYFTDMIYFTLNCRDYYIDNMLKFWNNEDFIGFMWDRMMLYPMNFRDVGSLHEYRISLEIRGIKNLHWKEPLWYKDHVRNNDRLQEKLKEIDEIES